MRVTVARMDSERHALYAQALAARSRSRVLAARWHAARDQIQETVQRTQDARSRAEQIQELWLAACSSPVRLQYSAYARQRARLASMPVIERAKGIIMARFGWPEDQAFDALRRASQRQNVKVRDLATQIVAQAGQRSAQPQPGPPPAAAAG